MHSFARAILVASVVALPLGGCANMDFDPGEWFAGELFSSKKPLPGERKPVFPEGVPGASKGIPPELVKGNELAVQEVAPPVTEPVAIVEEPKAAPKAKAKPKPKPKTAARPAEPEQDGVWPQQPQEPPPQRQQPAQQPPRQQQQQSQQQVQWPDPPSSQPRPQPGVQWPDPPPTR